MSGGGNVNVADGGADGGGARLRDCCRFPDGVFKELLEDLPYRLPFTLDIPLWVGLQVRGSLGDRDTYMDQRGGKNVGGSKGLNGLRTGSLW